MKKILKTVSAFLAAITLAAAAYAAPMPTVQKDAGKPETQPEETAPAETAAPETAPAKSPTDYTGKWHWKYNHENADVKVSITENTVAVYLHIMNADMGIFGNERAALYWYGTYTPPTKEGKHTWTSMTLLTDENRPLFATNESTKTFVYENGEISFPLKLTFAGETIDNTIVLVPYTADDGSAAEIADIYFTVEDNSLGGKNFHVITEVINTGTTDLYLDDSTFRFCDEENVILKEMNYVEAYPKIIAPGTSGYYYADTMLDEIAAEGVQEFYVGVDLNVYTNRSDILYFETYDVKLEEEYSGGVKAAVKVKNPYNQEIKPTVVVVLLDKDKKPLDVMTKTYETIPANSTKLIELSNWSQPDDIGMEDVAYYKAFSYIADDQYNFDW